MQTNVIGFGGGAPPFGEKRAGATITAVADSRNPAVALDKRYLIQDAAIPSALVDAMRVAMPLAAGASVDFAALQRIARDATARRSDGSSITAWSSFASATTAHRAKSNSTAARMRVWCGQA